MNRAELVKIIKEKTELSSLTVESVLCEVLNTIRDTVDAGEEVRLIGFGTFGCRKRSARTGRNVRTGEEISIPAKTVPTFKASKNFLSKDRKPV